MADCGRELRWFFSQEKNISGIFDIAKLMLEKSGEVGQNTHSLEVVLVVDRCLHLPMDSQRSHQGFPTGDRSIAVFPARHGAIPQVRWMVYDGISSTKIWMI